MVRISYSSVSPLTSSRRLCDVRFTSVRARIDLSNVTVNTRTGDFNATSLAHVINTETVNKLVVQTWLDRAGMFLNLSHCSGYSRSYQSNSKVDLSLLCKPSSRTRSHECVSHRGYRCSIFILWDSYGRTQSSNPFVQKWRFSHSGQLW